MLRQLPSAGSVSRSTTAVRSTFMTLTLGRKSLAVGGAVDEGADAFDFAVAEFEVFGVEEGGDEFFGAVVVEGGEQAAQRAAFGAVGADGGLVDVLAAVAFVFEHALIHENGEEGAHGGIARRQGNILLNFLRGGLPEAIDGIHDLPL